jgi:hypothetical protein
MAEHEYRPNARILRVPDTDQLTSEFGDLDAIPVVRTPRTLPPASMRKVV